MAFSFVHSKRGKHQPSKSTTAKLPILKFAVCCRAAHKMFSPDPKALPILVKKGRDCRVGNVSESNCSEVNSKQSLSRDPENGPSMLRSSQLLKPSIQVATPTMQQMNNKENAPHNMPKKVSLRETAI